MHCNFKDYETFKKLDKDTKKIGKKISNQLRLNGIAGAKTIFSEVSSFNTRYKKS